jgi:hypothetical protein
MKSRQEIVIKNRRSFLRSLLTGGAIGVFLPEMLKAGNPEPAAKTVKLLTPDGKLVEVDSSKIKSSADSSIASNAAVKEWMNIKNDKI